MQANNLFPLAKEGWKYLGITFLVLILSLVFDLDFLAFFVFVSFCFIAYAFRNPERELSQFENASLLSPVDGIVENIFVLQESKYAYKIEIQSNYTDVAILRAPANVSVKKIIKTHGTRLSSKSKLFENLNENVELEFLTKEENSFKVVHTLKKSFAPLFVSPIEEQKLFQTARYGLMLNGITAIYVPHNFRMDIAVGRELKASESLMGYFS